MPTKKQRRRQQKSRRHEYEYVYVDDEGNEVPVDPTEVRAEKNGKSETRSRDGANRAPARGAGRTIQPPSWRRAFKRAAIWGPLLVVAMMLLNRNVSPAQWVTSAVFLVAFFVPISYFTDSVAYRMYRKRMDRATASKSR